MQDTEVADTLPRGANKLQRIPRNIVCLCSCRSRRGLGWRAKAVPYFVFCMPTCSFASPAYCHLCLLPGTVLLLFRCLSIKNVPCGLSCCTDRLDFRVRAVRAVDYNSLAPHEHYSLAACPRLISFLFLRIWIVSVLVRCMIRSAAILAVAISVSARHTV
jgi:hypothetical protein